MAVTTLESDTATDVSGFPVPADSGNIAQLLADLITETGLDRQAAVGISNFTTSKLKNPKYYTESGKIDGSPPDHIDPAQANAWVAEKTSGALAGTEAVVTYDISGTSSKLAVLWSIPESYAIKQNMINLAITDKSASKNLYDELYANAAPADEGTYKVDQSGYKIKGIMGDGGQATVNISFKAHSSS